MNNLFIHVCTVVKLQICRKHFYSVLCLRFFYFVKYSNCYLKDFHSDQLQSLLCSQRCKKEVGLEKEEETTVNTISQMTCFINVLPRDFQLRPKLFWLQRVNSPVIIGVYHSSACDLFTFSLNQVTEVARPPRPTLPIFWQFQQQTQRGETMSFLSF